MKKKNKKKKKKALTYIVENNNKLVNNFDCILKIWTGKDCMDNDKSKGSLLHLL